MGSRYKFKERWEKGTRHKEGTGKKVQEPRGINSNLLTTDQCELVDNYFFSTNG